MAKLILSAAGLVLREIALSKERIRIGRAQHNEIVIEDPAVSTEHAVIVTHNNDSLLEDLNSTNGTKINGQPVKQHFLQDGDVIELARHQLLYRTEGAFMQDSNHHAPEIGLQREKETRPQAFIRILSGSNAGRELMLGKIFTTIGQVGMRIVAIERRADAYCLVPLVGEIARVNEAIASGESFPLKHGDLITLDGTTMQFCWK